MQKEHNTVLLIFSVIGFTVVMYYIGRFICKKIDEHNLKKVKKDEPKWFYK